MIRLRHAALAIALAGSGIGCTLCDECDDFPSSGGAYGDSYSMMPGSYTGPPLSVSPRSGPGETESPAPVPSTVAPPESATEPPPPGGNEPPPPAPAAPATERPASPYE
jgi:hypothetical protein